MRRRKGSSGNADHSEKGLLGISLSADQELSLAQRIYAAIREAIVKGRISPGQRLPSSRALADDLNVARGTVVESYEQLRVEGYVRTVRGSGTYVDKIPERFLHTSETIPIDVPTGSVASIADRTYDQPPSLVNFAQARSPRPFQPGLPPLDAFPRQVFARLWNEVVRSLTFEDLAYGDPGGYRPLRTAIASYLRTARAVQCEPEQVFVTNGAQHALGLAAHVLLDSGERAWVENPGFRGAKAAFLKAGLRVVPVPVDDEGISVVQGRELAPEARLACVTPSHQYPSGVTTSARRRLELIEWVSQSNAWILEDDYDSEYRYDGAPLPSLHHLDAGGHVVYCGSFSKVLAPGLRAGYLVVPTPLIDAFRRIRSADDHHCSIALQIVLARFIQRGHYGRHLRRLRKLGLKRRNALIEAFEKHLPGLELEGTGGGLHALVRLPVGYDDVALADRASSLDISLSPLSSYDLHDEPQRGLVLGYAAFSEDEIHRGVNRLATLL